MKYIVKLFPEIVVKSRSVRLFFIKILTKNISNTLKYYRNELTVIKYWDRIEIHLNNANISENVSSLLIYIPGIHHILKIEDTLFTSLHDISNKVIKQYSKKIENKTFCVRVKRRGKHKFTSVEAEKYIGGVLNQYIKTSNVKLVNPEIIINLEIDSNRLIMIKNRYEGIGGFPIGTQGDVLSLISGGFDSSVASYMLIRRGCRVHYCFFNFRGIKSDNINVYQVAFYLWKNFGNSHRVRFIIVNFELIIEEILKKISSSLMSVVLKRMMIRVSSKIAKRYGIQALVTGESIGQVASQTLTNLHIIDDVSDELIIRPIISYDKEHIIDISNKIGTDKLVFNIPEYCSIVSKKPTVKAIKDKILKEEKNFDLSILDKVIKESRCLTIDKIDQKIKKNLFNIEIVNNFGVNDVILDIRSIHESSNKPLKIKGIDILSLPFYKLSTRFANLDQNKTYLLWCDQGIMSRLQAISLREQGFVNVKVFSP